MTIKHLAPSLIALCTAACGGDSGGPVPMASASPGSSGPGSSAMTGTGNATSASPSSNPDPSAAASKTGASASEGTNSDLALQPGSDMQTSGMQDATMNPTPAPANAPQEPPGDNGRLVNGMCTLVCFDDSTDPDASGTTDGWGFEQGRSCITPDSALASNQPCTIPELAPLPALPPELPTGPVARPDGNLSSGFFVSNGRLFDSNGKDVILRGINHPVAWFPSNAIDWMDQIATTGSNSVRIVWEAKQTSTGILQQSIQRAIDLDMVPMVELHDVTGSNDVNAPTAMAQYYASQADLLQQFEPDLLINIANEWGDYNSTEDQWLQAYQQAITVLRDAGINHTLVIDANDYGQRGTTIINKGAALLAADPQHNILFSTHMYEEYKNPQSILDVIRSAQLMQLPLIVGEFGFQRGSAGQAIAVPYQTMTAEAQRVGIGYLAWSWTGNSQDVGYLDLSVDGSAGNLTDWGNDIINGASGIRATAQPASIFR